MREGIIKKLVKAVRKSSEDDWLPVGKERRVSDRRRAGASRVPFVERRKGERRKS